jgi:hypothetical protein
LGSRVYQQIAIGKYEKKESTTAANGTAATSNESAGSSPSQSRLFFFGPKENKIEIQI